MTRKEMNIVKDLMYSLTERVRENVRAELNAREVAMSDFIYGTPKKFYDEETKTLGYIGRTYLAENWEYGITEEEAIQIYFEQKKEFEQGQVIDNVFQNDGITYKGFKYRDEL